MKLPPAFNLDEAAAVTPGKMRLGDICSLVDDLLDDMRREMIQNIDQACVDEVAFFELVARIGVAIERLRLDFAKQLLAKTGEHD